MGFFVLYYSLFIIHYNGLPVHDNRIRVNRYNFKSATAETTSTLIKNLCFLCKRRAIDSYPLSLPDLIVNNSNQSVL